MKRILVTLLASILLLYFIGCTGNKPPESPADEGQLLAEELLGTYDIRYQSGTESGSRTVELRILNDRLTFAVYPDKGLDSNHSFDSYDSRNGEALLQRAQQDERGEFILSCKVMFTKDDGTIFISGNYTRMRGDMAEEDYTFSGELSEKL